MMIHNKRISRSLIAVLVVSFMWGCNLVEHVLQNGPGIKTIKPSSIVSNPNTPNNGNPESSAFNEEANSQSSDDTFDPPKKIDNRHLKYLRNFIKYAMATPYYEKEDGTRSAQIVIYRDADNPENALEFCIKLNISDKAYFMSMNKIGDHVPPFTKNTIAKNVATPGQRILSHDVDKDGIWTSATRIFAKHKKMKDWVYSESKRGLLSLFAQITQRFENEKWVPYYDSVIAVEKFKIFKAVPGDIKFKDIPKFIYVSDSVKASKLDSGTFKASDMILFRGPSLESYYGLLGNPLRLHEVGTVNALYRTFDTTRHVKYQADKHYLYTYAQANGPFVMVYVIPSKKKPNQDRAEAVKIISGDTAAPADPDFSNQDDVRAKLIRYQHLKIKDQSVKNVSLYATEFRTESGEVQYKHLFATTGNRNMANVEIYIPKEYRQFYTLLQIDALADKDAFLQEFIKTTINTVKDIPIPAQDNTQ